MALVWIGSAPFDFPLNQPIRIRAGSSLETISRDLAGARVVQSSLFFRLAARLSGSSDNLQAGDYWFERRLNPREVIGRLRDGRVVINPIKLTIPEGTTPTQIATIIRAKFPNLTEDELTTLIAENPAEAFPDTYFLPEAPSAADVVRRLRTNFIRQTADLRARTEKTARSWSDTLVLASLVEKEVSDPGDRRLVAGVLWKRLDAGMPLQVDVAPETYDRVGLPERAISNVGLDAIRAAQDPVASAHWYYLSDPDGQTHYAVDFEAHKKNRQKYLR